MPKDDHAELLHCVPDDVIQGALLPRRLLRQVRAETMAARLELGRSGTGACCVALRRRDSLVASEDVCIPVQGIDETLTDAMLLPRRAMTALGLREHQVMEVRLVGAHTLRAVRTVRLRPLSDGFMEAAAAVGVARAVAAVLSSACSIAPGCTFETTLPSPEDPFSTGDSTSLHVHSDAGGPRSAPVHSMQVLECDPPAGGLLMLADNGSAATHTSTTTVATFTLGTADKPAEPIDSQSAAESDFASGHRPTV